MSDKSSSDKKEIWKDPRFAHLVNDPRFKCLPKHEKKIKIDKRFQSMFDDSKFKIKYTVDKYGRKSDQTSTEDLKKYYDLDSSDTDLEEEETERKAEEKHITKVEDGSDTESLLDYNNDELVDDGEVLSNDVKKKLLDSECDYARGEGRLVTDSSSDDESSSDDDDEVYIEHVWGELDKDAPKTDESTRRLAACNMDWDRIRATDIMVLCNSFLPPGGTILSVKIYPSEFGKKRMQEEELHGPPELVKREQKNNESDSGDDDDDNEIKEQDSDAEEGDDYHMEKLRQYQLNRLKYYYAVIECDSVATADKLYEECDGLEYESTATKLDLRFIPDDVTFDEDEPRDICTEPPDLAKYKPRLFTTTALQQAKVELTWDETSIERKELSEKLASGKINEVSTAELKKFVAYSSEEENNEEETSENESEQKQSTAEESSDENESVDGTTDKKSKNNTISKYKAILEEINKKEAEQKKNKFEVKYSWTINPIKDDSEKIDTECKKNMTPIEKILEKRREKNKKRKEEKRKKLKGSDNEQSDDYSSDDMPDDIDLNDPYFAEEFQHGDFEAPKTNKKNDKKKSKIDTNETDPDDLQKIKELELLLEDDNDGKKHFSLKSIQNAETETKSKRKRKKLLKKSKKEIEASKTTETDNFEINLEDNRFKALYTSHLFNIDPSDPHYKKTKGMEKIIQEKLKRKYNNDGDNTKGTQADDGDDELKSKRSKKKAENSLLVKSIKRKIEGK